MEISTNDSINNPIVTVIVPIYNTENTLRKCVDSILNQSFTDYELLLIDDGSTDSSPIICDQYARLDSRIKVIHQANGGLSHVRNVGIKAAKGTWVSFVDSDDWIDSDYLGNFFMQLTDEDIIIQGYQYDSHRQGIVRYNNFESESSEYVLNHLFDTKESLVGVTVDKLYKREIIINHHLLFNKEICFAEDAIFFFEYLKYVKRIGVRSTIGYHYVITENGLTGKRHPTEYYLKILSLFIERLDNLNISLKFRNKYIWNLIEYWLIYPNMKYAYQEFKFDDMYRQITTFCDKYHLWNAPKISFTSTCLGWALRCNNSRKKYKYIEFIHLYIRRSENRIRGIFKKDFKKI